MHESSRQSPWLHVRIAAYALVFCWTAVAPLFMEHEFRDGLTEFAAALSPAFDVAILFYITFCLIACGMFILLFGLDAAVSPKSERWSLPSHRRNPFTWKHIHFLHFGGFLILAAAAGTLLSAAWAGPFWIIFGVMLLGVAGSILLAVRLSTRIYKHKFFPANTKIPQMNADEQDQHLLLTAEAQRTQR